MPVRRRRAALLAASSLLAPIGAARAAEAAYDVTGRTIASLERDLAAHRVTSATLVGLYAARIAALDAGPDGLHAVIALDPDAPAAARASDARRLEGAPARPLEGIPILLKDNIGTEGALPTTAGSMALLGNRTGDSTVAARLRAAGAIVLGKTNLSEWANFRSSFSISGWSAVGGLTHNPFARDRTACGSSSGSAVAVAASFAAAAIGTETDGSVTCPAAANGVVGFKPTLGLVPGDGIVPISPAQDTAGPIAHDVADAARLLSVLGGGDPRPAPPGRALAGVRLGVLRFLAGHGEATDAVFDAALARLRARGAVLVEVAKGPDLDAIGAAEGVALAGEARTALDRYLAAAPAAVATRSIADVLRFDEAHRERELALFGQDEFARAAASGGADAPDVVAARATASRLAGPEGAGRILAEGRFAALLAPTGGPAWAIDLVDGDHDVGSAATLPAVAGLPHLALPMGRVDGLPVGLSVIGPRGGDGDVLALGAAIAQALPPPPAPTLAATAPLTPGQRAALRPLAD